MNKKVLIADDSSIIQTLTKKILITAGYQVDGVKSGAKVMSMVEKNDYDAILMDINLPPKDGVSLTKEIRNLENKQKANTPVIAISGNYKNYTQEELNDIGIQDLLIKPLNYDDVVEAVRKRTQE